MKRVLLPLVLLLAGLVLLIAAAWLYERRWGSEGPFPSSHHHGGTEHEHEHGAD